MGPAESSTETASVPNRVILSWAFTQTPFLRPSNSNSNSSPKPSNFVRPSMILRDLRSSVMSTADNCLGFLHLFASENPALKQVLSWSSQFQGFCQQINCRKYRNMKSLSSHNFAAVIPGDSVAGIVVANGILNFLNIYNTLLIVRLVLTWFPNTPPAIVSPLSTICDPYLNIFRGIIPPLGGTLDFSPILAFLVLNAFTSTASALPAELPATGTPEEGCASLAKFTNITTSQQKWMRRLHGNKTESSSGVN
ncbi:ylmG homolog protein 2, chloroplastic [Alnus glutinosa]|uniref:ylmG homolog protein 2, chloroplastic n=1 Tax=Alnus glutinosa TaxID=3517 RepID=UPI002D79B6DF|nr:ylmG homolog protein 2, chloroplastic [Alnus glutinosa]